MWSSPNNAAPTTGGAVTTLVATPGTTARRPSSIASHQQGMPGREHAAAQHHVDRLVDARPSRRMAAAASATTSWACRADDVAGHRVARSATSKSTGVSS